MSVVCFRGNKNFFDELKGEKPTFLLGASVTKTCEIDGITQAGIPGSIPLTPTLDSEFITEGAVFSMGKIAETPKGVPTPALITRAIHTLLGFKEIKILDLGLSSFPKLKNVEDFAIKPSGDISTDSKIDVDEVFFKGFEYGKSLESDSSYIILGESTPAGTTTAAALTHSLGFNTTDSFSSSFKKVPNSIKERVIQKALKRAKDKEPKEKISLTADNMLIFTAGFLFSISEKKKIVLGGGTQMAAALLLADKLSTLYSLQLNHKNIALSTTKWIYEDKNSNIGKLLDQLSFDANGFYSDFDFSLSTVPVLKLYDTGEGKEGVGAGSALSFGLLNGLSKETITKEIEKFFQ